MTYIKYIIILTLSTVLTAVVIKLFNFDIHILSFMTQLLHLTNPSDSLPVNRIELFTNDKLKEYNGITRKLLYISICGNIYDVTRSWKHYGPGQPYHIFAGRDASISFVTGNFDLKETSDEVSNLSYDELLSLKQWHKFYENEYVRKGKLIGRYYDKYGNPTAYAKMIEKLVEEAKKNKNEKNLDNHKFPPCNIEWNPESKIRVWCSTRSGGIDRNWSGFPRKYYTPGEDSPRCACIKDSEDRNPQIALYEHCVSNSESCFITE